MKLEICHLDGMAGDSSPAEPAVPCGDACSHWQRPAPRRPASANPQATGKSGIEKAIYIIRHEYPRPLTVSSMARECGMSVRTLHRCYRSVTGNTIGKDLTARRIKAAAEMLEVDGSKLEPIALETGLGSAKNLCRLFKEHLGVTPGQWKESRNRQLAGRA
jgi:AraC family transcriptional regulator of arabinose operon